MEADLSAEKLSIGSTGTTGQVNSDLVVIGGSMTRAEAGSMGDEAAQIAGEIHYPVCRWTGVRRSTAVSFTPQEPTGLLWQRTRPRRRPNRGKSGGLTSQWTCFKHRGQARDLEGALQISPFRDETR